MGSKKEGVSVHSGFPNPATDKSLASLDLNKLLIKHSATTFFMTIEGNEWEESGIYNNDLIIIDRSLDAQKSDKVIWWVSDNFVIGNLSNVPDDTQIWGVVTNIIHTLR